MSAGSGRRSGVWEGAQAQWDEPSALPLCCASARHVLHTHDLWGLGFRLETQHQWEGKELPSKRPLPAQRGAGSWGAWGSPSTDGWRGSRWLGAAPSHNPAHSHHRMGEGEGPSQQAGAPASHGGGPRTPWGPQNPFCHAREEPDQSVPIAHPVPPRHSRAHTMQRCHVPTRPPLAGEGSAQTPPNEAWGPRRGSGSARGHRSPRAPCSSADSSRGRDGNFHSFASKSHPLAPAAPAGGAGSPGRTRGGAWGGCPPLASTLAGMSPCRGCVATRRCGGQRGPAALPSQPPPRRTAGVAPAPRQAGGGASGGAATGTAALRDPGARYGAPGGVRGTPTAGSSSRAVGEGSAPVSPSDPRPHRRPAPRFTGCRRAPVRR